MPTTSAISRMNRIRFFSSQMRVEVDGQAATTDAKMIIDMPLPMPRWLISSPIHMSIAVPATRVRMTRSRAAA